MKIRLCLAEALWRGRRRPPNFGGEVLDTVMPSAVAVGSSPLKPIGRSFGGGLDVTL